MHILGQKHIPDGQICRLDDGRFAHQVCVFEANVHLRECTLRWSLEGPPPGPRELESIRVPQDELAPGSIWRQLVSGEGARSSPGSAQPIGWTWTGPGWDRASPGSQS